jgi:hypothetical protein
MCSVVAIRLSVKDGAFAKILTMEIPLSFPSEHNVLGRPPCVRLFERPWVN